MWKYSVVVESERYFQRVMKSISLTSKPVESFFPFWTRATLKGPKSPKRSFFVPVVGESWVKITTNETKFVLNRTKKVTKGTENIREQLLQIEQIIAKREKKKCFAAFTALGNIAWPFATYCGLA